MTGRLQDKVVFVMGAGSRGQGWSNGRAASVLFAREGARVFAVDISADAAAETRDIIRREGGEAESFVADATDSASVKAAVGACVAAYGGFNVLHNNVGAAAPGDPVEMPEEVWERNMAINVTSAFLTCKHALPVIAAGGGGAIVNIASIAGIRNVERSLVGYQAGKAALIQLSRSVASQWAGRGVRSNCILPGLMKTPLVLDRIIANYATEDSRAAALAERGRMVPMGFMGDAWDTAWAAVYLASEESKYVTATEFTVDGGLTAGRPLDWRDPDAVAPPILVPDAEARSVRRDGGRLNGKVAIVVGAGSLGPGLGNGKASAILFAREGARVLAVDRNLDAVRQTQAIIEKEGGDCVAIDADALSASDVGRMAQTCLDAFGRIDIVHNNVGGSAGHDGPVTLDEAAWDANVSLNVKPAFLACKIIIPIMERQGGGVFVNTASTAGISVPEHPMISYQTGKAGLIQFSHGVALEYARKNIRSNCVIPGKIKTPMTEVRNTERSGADDVHHVYERRARSVPLGRMGEAWDVGYAALFLASDEARYVTATEILVDGGLTANCA
jgi:NAD(P)-dependent dehydrogenase (short-subunit alcohol dehydrogenase family)